MVVSNHHIVIARPLRKIYAYLMDLNNYPIWQSGIVRVAATDGMNQGSQITFTAIGLGKTFNFVAEVVENNAADAFRVVSTRGPMSFDSAYQLSDTKGGTKVELNNTIQTNAVFRLALPVLQSIGDSKYQTDLQTLKLVLEAAK
jgi:uncharacterized membrane protein